MAGAEFGNEVPGGFYYGTTVAKDGNNSPGANFAEFAGQSGGTLQVSQFISTLNDQDPAGDGVLQDDTGIAAVQIVANPVITAYTPIALANAVNVTANSSIDVTAQQCGRGQPGDRRQHPVGHRRWRRSQHTLFADGRRHHSQRQSDVQRRQQRLRSRHAHPGGAQ